MIGSKDFGMAALIVSGALALALPSIVQARGAGGQGAEPMPAFEAMDADKDGSVTQAEVAAFRAAAVAGADSNKDGLIDIDELTAHETSIAARLAQDHAARRMQAQDVDGDGKLSVEEMLAPPAPPRMFARLDSDGDGALSKAEFDAAKTNLGGHGLHHGSGVGGGHRGMPAEAQPKE